MTAKPQLVHITADLPDRVRSAGKTTAVARLLDTADWATHRVYSLNRVVSPWYSQDMVPDENGVASAQYLGLPFGLGLSHWMRVVSRRIERALGSESLRPDLIHAHKLTFEGIAACELSRAIGVPYCLTVRGFTDHKVIRAKPGLRRLYRRIVEDAAGVFFVAPWSRRILERQLGMDLAHAVMLPNVCPVLRQSPAVADAPVQRFVSVFHFKRHRGKNLANLLRALRLLQHGGKAPGLDLIGGATDAEVAEVSELARSHGVSDQVRALRAMDQDTLQRTLPNYIGMVLPSYPETFGLVYVEALAAGLPVIFARDAGIDGYIDDRRVARAVDHRDPAAIAAAMKDFMLDAEHGRAAAGAFRAAGGLKIFEAAHVGAIYRNAVQWMTVGAVTQVHRRDERRISS